MDVTLEAALFARRAQGMKLGLQAVTAAWIALGRPGQGIPTLHVVGTNGKGSTAAMCAAALQRLRRDGEGPVGLFTSPHLHHVAERVRLDGEPCEDAALEAAVRRVLALEPALEPALESALEVDAMPTAGEDVSRVLTFFEVLTLAALLVFVERGASALVLEAGLGGRLDATRVVPADVVVVTRIGLDHQQFLGPTLSAIAGEKAGAIRPGVAVITTDQAPEVHAVLEQAAKVAGAPMEVAPARPRAPKFLRGPHQRENAGLAARAVARLCRALHGRPAAASFACTEDEARIAAAFDGVSWPGRFEVTSWRAGPSEDAPAATVVFDVAHNPQGIATLTRTWAEQYGDPPDLVLFGCMADKEAPAMWRALPRASTRLVVPPPREGAHGFVPSLGEGMRLDGLDDLRLWSTLERVAMARGRVLVCGSFFLVGALRARILRGDAQGGDARRNLRVDALDLSDPVPRQPRHDPPRDSTAF